MRKIEKQIVEVMIYPGAESYMSSSLKGQSQDSVNVSPGMEVEPSAQKYFPLKVMMSISSGLKSRN